MKFVIFYQISRGKWWSDWIVSDVFLYYCLGKGYLIFYEAYTHPSLSAIILCNSPFTRFGKLVERGAAVMLSFRSFLYVGYSNSFEKSFIIMFPSQHLWYLPLFVFFYLLLVSLRLGEIYWRGGDMSRLFRVFWNVDLREGTLFLVWVDLGSV